MNTKISGLRWWIIGLIALATIINYIDRWTLAVMWPAISKDLKLDKDDYALILNTFMVAYAVGQLVSGRLFDAVGTRMGYVLSIIVWSLSSFMHSFARGALSFSILRSILGVGQAGNWPGAVKSNAEWFPVRERAAAQGIFNAGASLGAIVAPPLIGYLFFAFGWKSTFMIVGVFGFLWLIPWLIINKKHPSRHPWLTDKERQYIVSGQNSRDSKDEPGLGLIQILKHRESWAVLLGRFFTEPVWFFFMGWLPIYLFEVYKFDVKQIGMFAWMPYVGAAAGSLAGGWFSGWLIGKGKSVSYARKAAISVGGLLMFTGLAAVVSFADTPARLVPVLATVLFGFQFSISNIQTIPSDLFSGRSVGTLAGAGGMIGLSSVIMINFLVPVITEISYTPVFILIGLFVPLGALSVHLCAPKIKHLQESE